MGGLWRGEITPRRAAALAAKLPPGSAVWADMHHDAEWTQEAYILAALFDRMGSKDSKPYPRPSDRRAKQRHDDRAFLMAARFAEKQKNRAHPRRSTT